MAESDEYAAWVVEPDGSLRIGLSDGATNSYDAARWARILVEAFLGRTLVCETDRNRQVALVAAIAHRLESTRDPDGPAGTPSWLMDALRRGGSHATLVGMTVRGVRGRLHWQAVAVGDSVLFVVARDGTLARAFPISDPRRFTSSPDAIASDPPSFGRSMSHYRTRGVLPPGGSIAVASDALAKWALVRWRRGESPWTELRSAMRSSGAFVGFVDDLRTSGQLADDDVTLLIAARR